MSPESLLPIVRGQYLSRLLNPGLRHTLPPPQLQHHILQLDEDLFALTGIYMHFPRSSPSVPHDLVGGEAIFIHDRGDERELHA